jgi:sulfate adenylyltransferase subunit 1 (EFTu-like GTPase family)
MGQIGNPPELQFIPVSALCGDNVVRRSIRMPWYTGPALLEYLETVPIAGDNHAVGLRLPVQYVIRPNQDFRGLAGQLASGTIRPGDAVTVLPSGRETRVRSLVTPDGELDEAFAPMSVTVRLDEEVDVSRGDMLVAPADLPARARRFEATLVWMNEKPAAADRPYLLKHTTQTLPARIVQIRHRVDIHTLASQPAGELRLNEIGAVLIEAQRPLFFDPYRRNRFTGSFILLDPLTNETLGAGMIEAAAESSDAARSASIAVEGNPEVLWLLARRLVENGHRVVVLSSQLLVVGPEGAAPAVELSFTPPDLAEDPARAVDQIFQELFRRGVAGQN